MLASDGLGGLLVGLTRTGYLPVVTGPQFSSSIQEQGGVVVSIAPTEPFSAADSTSLTNLLESGGTLIISTSWPYAKPVEVFLAHFGLAIGNTPLGSIQTDGTDSSPSLQFTSAWPLYGSTEWVSIASAQLGDGEFTVVARRPVGKGQLVVIGDSSFLLTENLEGDGFYNEESLRFLDALLSNRAGT